MHKCFTSSGITGVLVESGGSTSATAFPMIPGEGINAYSVQVSMAKHRQTDLEDLDADYAWGFGSLACI